MMWPRKKNRASSPPAPPDESTLRMMHTVNAAVHTLADEMDRPLTQADLDAFAGPLNIALRQAGHEPSGWLTFTLREINGVSEIVVSTIDSEETMANTRDLAQQLPSIFDALAQSNNDHNAVADIVLSPGDNVTYEVHLDVAPSWADVDNYGCGMSQDPQHLGLCGGPVTTFKRIQPMTDGNDAFLRVCEQHEAALGELIMHGFERVT